MRCRGSDGEAANHALEGLDTGASLEQEHYEELNRLNLLTEDISGPTLSGWSQVTAAASRRSRDWNRG